jgi:hypothetical protein
MRQSSSALVRKGIVHLRESRSDSRSFAWHRVDFQSSAHLLDEGVHHGHTETGAMSGTLGREERLGNFGDCVRRDADPSVSDGYFDPTRR